MFFWRSAPLPNYFTKKSHDVPNDTLPSPLPLSSSPRHKHAAACHLRRATTMLLLSLFVFIPLSFCCVPHTVNFDLPFDNPPGIGWLRQWPRMHRRWTSAREASRLESTPGPKTTTTTATVVAFPTASLSPSTTTEVVVIPSTPAALLSASNTHIATSTTTLPVIPTSTPVLPTPFPQPLDSSLTRNFTTSACYEFFLNMTNTLPFRSCRPFSLLLQSSSQFTQVMSIPIPRPQCFHR
jgi:hypothetical protein